MTKNILFVEDDVFIRDIYSKMLSFGDYKIDTAEDGAIALSKATTNQYDLILLDIMLPKMSGIEVLRQLRVAAQPFRSTPVILITNLSDETIITDAMKLGINGYLLKAELSPEAFSKEVEQFFEKQTTPQQ